MSSYSPFGHSERGEILAGVGGRVAEERPCRRPKEGSQRKAEDGARRCFTPVVARSGTAQETELRRQTGRRARRTRLLSGDNVPLTNSAIPRTKSLRLCTQVSSLRVCGVGGLAWRRTSATVNLWLYL